MPPADRTSPHDSLTVESTPRTVGIVGCGAMGGAVARRLISVGMHVRAFDVDAVTMQKAVDAGCEATSSPAELAAGAEVVLISLPDGAIVERALFDAGGVVEGGGANAVIVDLSTVHPDESRKFGARLDIDGIDYLDCPVGRSTAHAERGELLVMVGGDPRTVDRVRWLLGQLGDVIECGPRGAGATVKLANNLCATTILAASIEALTMASIEGVSPEAAIKVLSLTAADNASLHGAIPHKVLPGDFTLGFKTSLALKDIRLANSVLDAHGIDASISRAATTAYERAVAAGHGNLDASAYAQLFPLRSQIGVTGAIPTTTNIEEAT